MQSHTFSSLAANGADIQSTWDKVHVGVDHIMNKLEEGLSYRRYMDLYTLVYNHCTSSRMTGASEALNSGINGSNTKGANLIGQELYNRLREYLRAHLQKLLAGAEEHRDESLLVYYTKQWEKYTMASALVHHIFRYLNRHWVKREMDEGHKNIYDVYTLSLVTWKEHLFMAVQSQVMTSVLALVERQRNGETIDNRLIKLVVESFVSLGLDENDSTKSTLDVYKEYFEKPFLIDTERYYSAESKKFISENSVMDYMKKAETRLAEEENRVQLYLHETSRKPLIEKCQEVLISNHAVPIQDEFQNLLDQDKIEDLTRMYGLLSRIPDSLKKLREIFEAHVRKQGWLAAEKVAEAAESAHTDKAGGGDDEDGGEDEETPAAKRKSAPGKKKGSDVDPKVYVDALLEVQTKFSGMVATAFKSEAGFTESLDKACKEYVNRNAVCKTSSSRSPELLAKYCDSLLRKSSRVEDNEMDELLKRIMIIFKYIEERDVFQKFYFRMLARRLVNDQSASDDAEAGVISKMKEVCGFDYTSKLHKIIQDMTISNDLNKNFRTQMESNHDKEELIDLDMKVVCSGNWPANLGQSAGGENFKLPAELLKTYERFTGFYTNKHSGRKLNWLFHMSRGEVKSSFSKTKYIFTVTCFQMGVLLQYNDGLSYTWEELSASTGLDKDSLAGALTPLLRSRLLKQDGEGGYGVKDVKYELNTDFKSKKIKINLAQPVRTEQKKEADETHKNIEEDRKILIQAAIVRIMKTRKTLKHQALITEVIDQLKSRFKPSIPLIKKCIDILLEKEYIERSSEAKDIFNYVA